MIFHLTNGQLKVALSKEKFYTKDLWVVSSFPLYKEKTKEIKSEIKDTIATVNADYNYTPLYSSIHKEVGALISNLNISKNNNFSKER